MQTTIKIDGTEGYVLLSAIGGRLEIIAGMKDRLQRETIVIDDN